MVENPGSVFGPGGLRCPTPKNYYLRSQEEEIIVHQPQSLSRQPEVPPPELQPVEPVEPEPEPPLFTEQHPMMSNQINLEAYRGQGEDAQKWFTYFKKVEHVHELQRGT